VLRFSDDLAFIFALRQFDQLYDGNMFQKKDDGFWYNLCNLQGFVASEIAEDANEAAERILQKQSSQGTNNVPKQVPKIIKMFPENGAKNVDPNISQVYLTFDVPMEKGHAWVRQNDNTILDYDRDNPIFWTTDKLTCVAPVVLKPNKKYEIQLNSKNFICFVSAEDVPLESVFYTFETGAGPIDSQKRKEIAKGNFDPPNQPAK
jgi:hypothetical protein